MLKGTPQKLRDAHWHKRLEKKKKRRAMLKRVHHHVKLPKPELQTVEPVLQPVKPRLTRKHGRIISFFKRIFKLE